MRTFNIETEPGRLDCSLCGAVRILNVTRRTSKENPLRTLGGSGRSRCVCVCMWNIASELSAGPGGGRITAAVAWCKLQTLKHSSCKDALARVLVDPGQKAPILTGRFCRETQSTGPARRPCQDTLSRYLAQRSCKNPTKENLAAVLHRSPLQSSCAGPGRISLQAILKLYINDPLLDPAHKSCQKDPTQTSCAEILQRSCQDPPLIRPCKFALALGPS